MVFWNANGWNAQNCEKVALTVNEAGADVLCITDARLDASRSRYISGYCHTLKKATGKNDFAKKLRFGRSFHTQTFYVLLFPWNREKSGFSYIKRKLDKSFHHTYTVISSTQEFEY